MKETKWFQSTARFFEALRPMTWLERIDHIFSYYKELVFVVSVALIVCLALAISFSGNRAEVIFGGGFANVDIDREGYTYLTDGVMALYGGDPKKQKVELSSTAFREVTQASQLDYNYNAAMSLVAKIDDGTLDFLVMDEDAMKFYMTRYALMDLREVFTPGELAEMEDDLVYIYLEVEQVRYPIAVDITALPFCQECVDVTVPVYFGFTGTGEEREQYRAFWRYLTDWTPKDGNGE